MQHVLNPALKKHVSLVHVQPAEATHACRLLEKVKYLENLRFNDTLRPNI